MKLKYKLPLIAGAFLVNSLFGYSQAQEKSSFADSIMAESEKYPTTTHFIYEILKNSETNFHNVNKLEKIIKNVEKEFEKKWGYSQNEVLDILLAADKEIKDQDLKIKTFPLDCDDLSYIYNAIGERFNLNLFVVQVPDCMFIRYDSDEKHDALNSNNSVNNGDFNLETTNLEVYGDEYHKKWRNISKYSIEKGVYLKNLTKQELIARAYCTRGIIFSKKGDYDLAIQEYNRAIELDSNYAKAHYYKANAFFDNLDYDLAIQEYTKAIELDPNHAMAYDGRKTLYRIFGNLRKANLDLKKYEELKGKRPPRDF